LSDFKVVVFESSKGPTYWSTKAQKDTKGYQRIVLAISMVVRDIATGVVTRKLLVFEDVSKQVGVIAKNFL
jgi:hypothetical protein